MKCTLRNGQRVQWALGNLVQDPRSATCESPSCFTRSRRLAAAGPGAASHAPFTETRFVRYHSCRWYRMHARARRNPACRLLKPLAKLRARSARDVVCSRAIDSLRKASSLASSALYPHPLSTHQPWRFARPLLRALFLFLLLSSFPLLSFGTGLSAAPPLN